MMSCCKKLPEDWTYKLLCPLWKYMLLVLPSRTRSFEDHCEVSGKKGTRLAMPKTNLRARLLIIEARFRGY